MGETVERYSKEVVQLADDMRDEAIERNQRLDAGTYTNYDDPTQKWLPPRRLDEVPYINFAPLQNAVARLNESAKAYDSVRRDRLAGAGPIPEGTRRDLDAALLQCERSLTREQGLPRRPWFVHQVYAPGFYTGYGVKTLPGVREAIEQRDWKEAEAQVGIVADVLLKYAENIDRAAALLRPVATASR